MTCKRCGGYSKRTLCDRCAWDIKVMIQKSEQRQKVINKELNQEGKKFLYGN